MHAVALIVATLCAFLGILSYMWQKRLRCYAGFKFDKLVPFFGNALSIPSKPHDFVLYILNLHKKLGSTFIIWLGFKPVMFTCDVDIVESLLSSQLHITKSSLYDFLHDWLGTGLLTSTGMKWKTRRRLLTPTFHFSILNNFADVFERQGKILAEKLNSFAESGKAFDIQGPVGRCALDIICETAMGVHCNAQEASDSEYVSAVLALSRHAQMRQKNPLLWPEFIFRLSGEGRRQAKSLNTVLSFTRKVITERIELRAKATASGNKIAFLDLLLDSYTKGDIDFEGIREEVDTFMFEGHDTTAAAMSWTLFLLGHHPEVQAKLHAEIDSTSVGDKSAVEQVKGLKYLESVIKEALRLYPSVSIYARRLEADLAHKGIVIPSGTELTVLAYGLHHSPDLWERPDDFIPERFLSDEYNKRNPFQYVPFSAGPRNCIGQKFASLEEKIVLFQLLKRFQVTSMQSVEQVELCAELITRSGNGLWVQLSKR